MFRKISLFAVLALFLQYSCSKRFQDDKSLIMSAFNNGDFTLATTLIDKSLSGGSLKKDQAEWLTIRKAMMERIRLDFSRTEKQIRSQLFRYYPVISDSLMNSWEKSGHLEMRMIDGARKYFKYSVSNLFRLDTAAARIRRALIPPVPDPLDSIRIANTSEILHAGKPGQPAVIRRITLEYSIIVDANAVPAGEDIKCWMPFPRISEPRQGNVILLASDPAEMVRSAPACLHSSLFCTKKAEAGLPTRFSYKAVFDISGQWFSPEQVQSSTIRKIPSDKKEYLAEEPPHVAFTPLVRHLADSLAGSETNPAIIIRKFYYWIDQNIPWASALEYSTFECIPDYVLTQRHGDCGMVTFLLMSMARYKGIPARWQSGWMLHPGQENLHDWCEIWFSSVGWIPVDMSFGLQNTDNLILKDFYLTGIDSYRMIVNDGLARQFDPPKTYFRSEPFDFQRGEVEWSKGNLYFNQWDYKLNVVSIENVDQ